MNNDARGGVIFGLGAVAASFLAVAVVIALIVIGVIVAQAIGTSNAKHQGVINNIQSHNYVHSAAYQQSQREAVTANPQED